MDRGKRGPIISSTPSHTTHHHAPRTQGRAGRGAAAAPESKYIGACVVVGCRRAPPPLHACPTTHQHQTPAFQSLSIHLRRRRRVGGAGTGGLGGGQAVPEGGGAPGQGDGACVGDGDLNALRVDGYFITYSQPTAPPNQHRRRWSWPAWGTGSTSSSRCIGDT